MGELFDPQFVNIADYDCIVQIQFNDIQDFVKLKADPFYKSKVTPDHENKVSITTCSHQFLTDRI
jgi:hypothetical protein